MFKIFLYFKRAARWNQGPYIATSILQAEPVQSGFSFFLSKQGNEQITPEQWVGEGQNKCHSCLEFPTLLLELSNASHRAAVRLTWIPTCCGSFLCAALKSCAHSILSTRDLAGNMAYLYYRGKWGSRGSDLYRELRIPLTPPRSSGLFNLSTLVSTQNTGLVVESA